MNRYQRWPTEKEQALVELIVESGGMRSDAMVRNRGFTNLLNNDAIANNRRGWWGTTLRAPDKLRKGVTNMKNYWIQHDFKVWKEKLALYGLFDPSIDAGVVRPEDHQPDEDQQPPEEDQQPQDDQDHQPENLPPEDHQQEDHQPDDTTIGLLPRRRSSIIQKSRSSATLATPARSGQRNILLPPRPPTVHATPGQGQRSNLGLPIRRCLSASPSDPPTPRGVETPPNIRRTFAASTPPTSMGPPEPPSPFQNLYETLSQNGADPDTLNDVAFYITEDQIRRDCLESQGAVNAGLFAYAKQFSENNQDYVSWRRSSLTEIKAKMSTRKGEDSNIMGQIAPAEDEQKQQAIQELGDDQKPPAKDDHGEEEVQECGEWITSPVARLDTSADEPEKKSRRTSFFGLW